MRLRTDRSYFVLLVAFLGGIGIIDTAILNPAIASYATALGADLFQASFIAGLYSLVAIPASLAMGLTIDVIGRRRALIIGLGFTALWIYGYSIAANPLQLMLFRITHSLSGSLVFPASIAMIVDATRQKMGRSIGLFWVVIGSVILIGSGISATLVTTLGFRSMFVLIAVISLAGLALALYVPETARDRVMPRVSVGIIASSLRWLSVAYVSIFSLYFAFGAIVGSLPLVFIQGGASEEAAALSTAIYIILATAISLPVFYLVGRLMERLGPFRMLLTGISLAALSQAIMVVAIGPPLLYVSAAALGGAIALVYVASTALAALPRARGASIGLHQTANIAGVAAGAPLSGLVLQSLGGLAPFTLTALVQVVTLTFIMASRKATKRAELQVLETPGQPLYPDVARGRR